MAIVLGGLTSACAPQVAPTTKAAIARPDHLPDLPLSRLDGEHATMNAVTDGRPTLLVLWATWCDECKRELDDVARLERTLDGAGVRVIRVAVGEPRATVAAFVKSNAVGGIHLVDEDFRFADTLGETRVPTFLLVDRSRRIVRIDHELGPSMTRASAGLASAPEGD